MKHLLKIILINMLVFFVLAFVVTSLTLSEHCGASVPDTPHVFQGYANYGGTPQAGQTVIATLDGVNEGEGFTDTTDSNGWYEVGPTRCGNSSAEAITFTVCTRTANETATFASSTGTPTELNLTITSACPTEAAPPTGGGGGGGAAAVTTTVISFTTAGVDVSLAKNNIARFAFGGVYHTIKVTKIGADYVILEIASDPVTITLKLLESRKLDLNNDNYYDLYVKLNEIKSSKAYLTVKYIHEIITPVTPVAEEEEEEEPEEVEEEVEEVTEEEEEITEEEILPAKPKTAMIIVLIAAVLALIAYLIYKKKKGY